MVTNEPILPKKKVYLISNRQSDVLLNLLKQTPFISEVRIGSPNIIPELTESFLCLFDCFIYDLYDNIALAKVNYSNWATEPIVGAGYQGDNFDYSSLGD